MSAIDLGKRTEQGQARGRVKGTLVLARLKYLRAHAPAELGTVLGLLPPSDRSVLEGLLLPSSWYAAELVERLEDAIATALSKGDRAASFWDMGRFSADTNFGEGGVRRTYIRHGEPHHVLSLVPNIYRAIYDMGSREYLEVDAHSAIISSRTEPFSRDHCHAAMGWLQRLVELSDGKDVRVSEQACLGSGALRCKYYIEWRAP